MRRCVCYVSTLALAASSCQANATQSVCRRIVTFEYFNRLSSMYWTHLIISIVQLNKSPNYEAALISIENIKWIWINGRLSSLCGSFSPTYKLTLYSTFYLSFIFFRTNVNTHSSWNMIEYSRVPGNQWRQFFFTWAPVFTFNHITTMHFEFRRSRYRTAAH